jgi:hypothetical protein
MTPKHRLQQKKDKLDFIKMETFVKLKGILNRKGSVQNKRKFLKIKYLKRDDIQNVLRTPNLQQIKQQLGTGGSRL